MSSTCRVGMGIGVGVGLKGVGEDKGVGENVGDKLMVGCRVSVKVQVQRNLICGNLGSLFDRLGRLLGHRQHLGEREDENLAEG